MVFIQQWITVDIFSTGFNLGKFVDQARRYRAKLRQKSDTRPGDEIPKSSKDKSRYRGKQAAANREAPTPTAQCYVGFEYECNLGHRFFLSPENIEVNDVLKLLSSGAPPPTSNSAKVTF